MQLRIMLQLRAPKQLAPALQDLWKQSMISFASKCLLRASIHHVYRLTPGSNCGCNNEDAKYWDGDMQFPGQIICNTCGSYFRDHGVSRPEREWNPEPRRQAFYNFEEDSDSAIPDTLMIHDPRHKHTTFLEAYTHHLRITLEVRHHLEENFERGTPPPRPRYRYKLGEKRIPYAASIQDGYKSTYDFLLSSEEAQFLDIIARVLHYTDSNWDDWRTWLDVSIVMQRKGIQGPADYLDIHRWWEIAEDIPEGNELKEMSREMQRLDGLGVQRSIEWCAPVTPGRFSDEVVEALGYAEGAKCDDDLEDMY